jgi:predicted lipid-binding transport protein (Tim44 family)
MPVAPVDAIWRAHGNGCRLLPSSHHRQSDIERRNRQESIMNANIKKIAVSGLVALPVAGTLASAPARAKLMPWPKQPFPHKGFGGWGAGGLIGGLALGAMAARAAPSYDCGTVREVVVDRFGDVIGHRYVPAC